MPNYNDNLNSVKSPRKFAFVLPRFGSGIIGGEVSLVGALASKLAARGDQVTILSSCAKDNRNWENFFPAGSSQEDGLEIIRFPVNSRNLETWIPLQIQISQGMQLSLEDQLLWMQESVNSSDLYSYIQKNTNNFELLFFAPYLFGTTFWGALIHPHKSLLIPCLHDEPYAYLDIIASLFRQVRGCVFNAAPEQDLANSLYGRIPGAEVGMGFEPLTTEYLDSLSPFFSESFPYLIYVGRKETGKNAHILLDYFIELKSKSNLSKELSDLRLVILGGGSFSDLERPAALQRKDIIDLANLKEEDKLRLIKHAKLLCQPSTNESFSIVIMESWLLGTPVLVHADCAVTKNHVCCSGGGLYFSNSAEFSQTVCEICTRTELKNQLSLAGLNYVINKYNWSAVLDRFDLLINTASQTLPSYDCKS